VPVTADPPCVAKVKVEEVIVDAFIAVLKVAVTAELTATPVLALGGVTAVIVGAIGGGGLLPLVELEPPQPTTNKAAETSHKAVDDRITRHSLRLFRS
jgi:hypothetical protein